MRKTERKKQEKCRKRHPVQPLFERACKNLNIEGDKEMTTLIEAISLKGRTIETVATYVQQYIDAHWQEVMEQHRPVLEEIFARAAEQVYARYSQELFQPLTAEFKQASLTCDPTFPGTIPLSREQWGPQEERERRFWCVLHQENEGILGPLLTCYFHDHTRFRIPRSPRVVASEQTNHIVIALMVERSAFPGLQAS
jgi:hypothetical protein